MTAFAALTINDGAATPAAHTFSPVKIYPDGVAKYADKVGGIPVGFPVVSLQIREPNKQSKAYRVFGKVQLPVLEQTSASTSTGIQPAPTVAYNLFGNFDFTLPERSSKLERSHILAYTANAMAQAVVTAMVKDLDDVY